MERLDSNQAKIYGLILVHGRSFVELSLAAMIELRNYYHNRLSDPTITMEDCVLCDACTFCEQCPWMIYDPVDYSKYQWQPCIEASRRFFKDHANKELGTNIEKLRKGNYPAWNLLRVDQLGRWIKDYEVALYYYGGKHDESKS